MLASSLGNFEGFQMLGDSCDPAVYLRDLDDCAGQGYDESPSVLGLMSGCNLCSLLHLSVSWLHGGLCCSTGFLSWFHRNLTSTVSPEGNTCYKPSRLLFLPFTHLRLSLSCGRLSTRNLHDKQSCFETRLTSIGERRDPKSFTKLFTEELHCL